MNTGLGAVVVLSTLAAAGLGVVIASVALVLGFIALFLFWFYESRRPLHLFRFKENPILGPDPTHWWESAAVFNPAAVVDQGRVHMLYRAMGTDGISRIGYASSADGIHFDERLPYPVLEPRGGFGMPTLPNRLGPLTYNTVAYASGGGWAGFEDPRIVKIDDRAYVTFVAFDGWGYVRMALTSINRENFLKKNWDWVKPALISPPGEIHKNWVLFPEKIKGKYAILHSIAPAIQVEYIENLDSFHEEDMHIKSKFMPHRNENRWDTWIRGAGPPPLKTRFGWLLLYHAIDERESHRYKVGVMLLDLKDPTHVLARSNVPILEPSEWYENDWKPGVVYATGAVILGNDLIVYYGGGDKHIAAARANLRDFVYKLLSNEHAVLEPVKV
ncbi:hypothetical protein A2943_01765 [Candidatus Adlerbacteria bacterium RIFCSPLOWO2_01_FULL_51_16]|uniref:Glycosidase n=1 Tax=Candidatus Adlerbacteria bacterium RIFCSPLOWO2_01_FULL_51_16 TaxID=1797243 RepID=A0A1F4XH59_9BACT|nr:MAG: hypothetical protein A2943_01765 [Candidatus Adlerbacteria bacterium RIFCSPLOWO2_01_FULL_51_16]